MLLAVRALPRVAGDALAARMRAPCIGSSLHVVARAAPGATRLIVVALRQTEIRVAALRPTSISTAHSQKIHPSPK